MVLGLPVVPEVIVSMPTSYGAARGHSAGGGTAAAAAAATGLAHTEVLVKREEGREGKGRGRVQVR